MPFPEKKPLGRRLLGRIAKTDPFDALVVLTACLILAAWTTGISRRGWDYDEIEHAHVLWLIGKGLRPFQDFFEDHPPFLWYPLSLLPRIFGEGYALLFTYRAAAGIGHLLFIAAIAMNVHLSFRAMSVFSRTSIRTFVLSAAILVGHPAVVDYLIEFRLDAWPNALLFFAIYRYRGVAPAATRADGQVMKDAARFAFLATAAILCSPKLMLFLAFFTVSHLVAADLRWPRLKGMAAGALGCLFLGAAILLVGRINFVHFFKLVYTYHRILNKEGGFGHGLANAVWQFPLLLTIVMVSAAACLLTLRRRILSSPFELAALLFSTAQLILVSFRYKQYYGPWFLLTLTFIPYLELQLRRVRPAHALVLAIAVLFAATNALTSWQAYEQTNDAASEISFRKWVEKMVPADGMVAASDEVMPVYRRSVFYHWTTSFAPSGHATEAIMQDLGMGAKFTEAYYLQELETKRPDAIVLDGWFTALQRRALDSYLARFGGEYRRLDSPRGSVFARLK